MSSEEEMHMLPSFCEGVPSDMSPSEWCFGAISDVASGIITSFWRMGFKWRKGSVEAFSGERGPNGERETRGVFWRTGFTMAITSYRQATGVQNGDRGSLFGKQDYYEVVGVQLR